jgi:hypothetical protein
MSECFPSVFRGIGVGFVAIIGRAGCIFAPFVSDTLTSEDIYPQISFGVVSFLVLFLVVPANETFGRGLSESFGKINYHLDNSITSLRSENINNDNLRRYPIVHL